MAGFLIGLITGSLGGLVGIGGGVIVVPLMTEALKFRQHEAHGTSLVAVVFTSLVGSVIYYLLSLRFGGHYGSGRFVRHGPLHGPFRGEVLLFPPRIAAEALLRPFSPLHLSLADPEAFSTERLGGLIAPLGQVDGPGPPWRSDRFRLRDDGGRGGELHGADDGPVCRHRPAYRSGNLPPGDDSGLHSRGMDLLEVGKYSDRNPARPCHRRAHGGLCRGKRCPPHPGEGTGASLFDPSGLYSLSVSAGRITNDADLHAILNIS